MTTAHRGTGTAGPPAAGTVPALRFWLRADAAVTGLNGLVYLLAAPLVQDVIGVRSGWLRGLGAFLVVFAAAVLLVSARARRPAVGAVIAVNAAWVLASAVLALVGGLGASAVGRVWVLAQAVVVAAFALMQARSLPAAPR